MCNGKVVNNMWGVIFGTVIILAGLGFVYMTFCISRFGGIQKLAKSNKRFSFLISLGIVAVTFGLLYLIMGAVNAVLVLLHEVLLFLLFRLIFRLIKKIKGKEPRFYLAGWLALLTSVVYLAVGWYLCHSVVRKDYDLTTAKPIGSLKIALIADSHIGTTFDGEGFAEHLKTIEEQSPDLLIIAGDFVDDGSRLADIRTACEALGKMQLKYGVWYSYGNHDKGYFNRKDYTPSQLEQSLKENGIHILADEYELIDDRFYIVGRKDARDQRLEMEPLLKGIDTSKYIIVIDHQPNDYENEAASAADLVLSGHTHGGQLIPATFVGEWLGMNDRTYGYERRSDTDFIVTSGISDWEIKFKTGTRSEYVIINVSQS